MLRWVGFVDFVLCWIVLVRLGLVV